jgi:predicted DNA-binding protein with PD1-like motif
MRGGAFINSSDDLNQKLQSRPDIKTKLISAFGLLDDATVNDIFNAVARQYNGTTINPTEVISRDGPIRSVPELVTFFKTFQ